MKRSTATVPTRVFVYALPMGPTENADLVREQLFHTHLYRNKLVEIENARRVAYRVAAVEMYPEIDVLDREDERISSELAPLRDQLKGAKKDSSGASLVARLKAEIEDLKSKRDVARNDRKKLWAAFRRSPEGQATQKRLDAQARADISAARAASEAFSGSRELADDAFDRQKKDTPPWTLCRFRRFSGEGRLGVRIRGGGIPAVGLVGGGDQHIKVGDVDERAWFGTRSERRRLNRTELQMRIATADRAPVWGTFAMTMHRPLPRDGVVKGAFIEAKREGGTHLRWKVGFVVQAPSFQAPEKPVRSVAALNFGWRLRPHGLRVAMLADSDGVEREIVIDKGIVDAINHSDSIQGIQDREFNAVKELLAEEIRGLETPEWFTEDLRCLAQWKSSARLAKVVRKWQSNRFAGDEAAYELAEKWRRQNRHLYQWHRAERRRAELRRRELFRIVAKELALRYDMLIVDGTKFSDLAKRKTRDAETEMTELHQDARHNRFVAAPGELRTTIRHATPKHGARFRTEKPKWITKTCSSCGEKCGAAAGEDLFFRCERSGEIIDQDVNAARNLLKTHAPEQLAECAE